MNVAAAITAAIGAAPSGLRALGGGCVGEVYRAEFPDRDPLVVKIDQSDKGLLDIEGFMLDRLAPHLPVPKVVFASPGLLAMQWVDGSSSYSDAAEQHAAELLARLHSVDAHQFGLERDTVIGGLHQPNPWSSDWLPFFAEHRLSFMAREAHTHGRLSSATVRRVETLAADLDTFLEEPGKPALLHGDVWSGNVLSRGGEITGFLDPAIYFGHAEVELAFVTMFGTFGERFFEAYDSVRGIEPGFFEERRHIYNLYPYLVHVRLFGGSYVASVEGTLSRLGC